MGYPAPVTSPRAVLPLQWAVNQLLTAVVIGNPRENYMRLNIGGTAVTARTDLSLAAGQKIALRVVNVGPTIVLKVLDPSAAAPAIQRALARVLPVHGSLPETVDLLREFTALARRPTVAQTTDQRVSQRPQGLSQSAADLIAKFPQVHQLTEPKSLRRALAQTALPTEARLNTAAIEGRAPDLNGDIRWHLIRIRQQVDTPRSTAGEIQATSSRAAGSRADPQLPAVRTTQPVRNEPIPPASNGAEERIPGTEVTAPRLRQLIDAAVARLQAHQLQNVNAPGGATSVVIEVPVLRGGDIDLLRFEYDAQDGHHGQSDEAEPRANLTLSLHMDDGKEFAAQIRVLGEALNIRVSSNHAGMNELIERRLTSLRRGIEQHGFELSGLVVGPVEIDTRPRLLVERLVDDNV